MWGAEGVQTSRSRVEYLPESDGLESDLYLLESHRQLIFFRVAQVASIDEVEYTMTMGMLVCRHTVEIWTGSNTMDLDAVHADTDDAHWHTIVSDERPMTG